MTTFPSSTGRVAASSLRSAWTTSSLRAARYSSSTKLRFGAKAAAEEVKVAARVCDDGGVVKHEWEFVGGGRERDTESFMSSTIHTLGRSRTEETSRVVDHWKIRDIYTNLVSPQPTTTMSSSEATLTTNDPSPERKTSPDTERRERLAAEREAKRIRYSKPSRREMLYFVENFIRYQKWQEKAGFNHFGDDVVSFLGPRRVEFDDLACEELREIYAGRKRRINSTVTTVKY